MSEYIQPGGGYYGAARRLPAKSVYYSAPEQQPQQLLGEYGAAAGADQQLPPGAVPVINLPQAPQPGGFKILSFNQQEVAAAPQLQHHQQQQYQQQPQQYLAQALQQPQQQQGYAAGGAPTLVNSDYAAAGWGAQQYVTPIRIINAPQTQQQQAQALASQAELRQAESEYQQAMAMAQRAAERLGQLNGGLTPQVQYSGYGAQAAAAPQTVPGVQLPAAAAQREQSQVRFGGVQRIPTPSNSSYRFEDAGQGKPAPRKFNQQQADSVYIGMPNNLFLAANRPQQGYHFAPQQQAAPAAAAAQPQQAAYRQPSNANLRTARENASNANLRRMLSEENVRTAILNEGNVIGRVETRYTAAAAGGQHQHQQEKKVAAGGAGGGLQGGSSSDYHFDDLRGLNSAY